MSRRYSLAGPVLCVVFLAGCASTSVPPAEGQPDSGPKSAQVLETTGGVLKSILSFFSVGVVVR